MTLRTTAGQALLQDALPPDMRGPLTLDKKGTANLLRELGQKHPELYPEVLHRLGKLGHQAAYWTGGHSFGLEHLLVPESVKALRRKLQQEVAAVHADTSLTDQQKQDRVVKLTASYQEPLEKLVWEESTRENNPLAMQVLSGARGNKTNLRSLRGSDLLYVDHRDRPIPMPVLRSYSEGLRPAEYFANLFGARRGVLDVKFGVADSGFLGKQLTQMTHRLLVTSHDGEHDPAMVRGLPVDTDDTDNEGAALAQDTGPYKRNTILTPGVLQDLKEKGHERILVRSPTVGGPPEGGVYSMDVGVREKGHPAPQGDFVGIAAAQALSEPVTQGGLGSKHSGGVAGASKTVSGFPLIDQLVQTPKVFQGGAAHAQLDGKVDHVEPAPQGGSYVTVGGVRHHAAQGMDVLVKPGQEVEAGDVLSEGIPNPAEVVRHKGVGEGRRYFTHVFRDAYKRSGMPAHRRNVELVARGLIDHVRLTDEVGHHAPGDLVPYSRLEAAWQPRDGFDVQAPKAALGRYLESPVLHYTVGTRVRPSTVRDLEHFGVKQVTTHHEPPPFEPEMVRGLESLGADPDWMTRFLGSYGKKNLLRGVHRGDLSEENSTSYVPSLARGVDFNTKAPVQGWQPAKFSLTSEK